MKLLKLLGPIACLTGILLTWLIDSLTASLPQMPPRTWVSLLLILIIILIKPWHQTPKKSKWPSKFKLNRVHKNILKNLTRDQKELLIPYINENTSTQYFELNDGVACSLEQLNIICRSSNMGQSLSFEFPFSLQPWARKMLLKHPEYLSL